jgi:hypothetical protein
MKCKKASESPSRIHLLGKSTQFQSDYSYAEPLTTQEIDDVGSAVRDISKNGLEAFSFQKSDFKATVKHFENELERYKGRLKNLGMLK